MSGTRLLSMWWRSYRGLIHRLQLGGTLSCVGLMSNRRELALRPIAGGVLDLRALRGQQNTGTSRSEFDHMRRPLQPDPA
jgi:hypothetical protein